MQVLAVGPSRSGTSSLREALLQLGYHHTYHGFDTVVHPEDDIIWHKLRLKREKLGPGSLTAADFDQVIGHCAAVTDHAATAFALDLIAAYPDAKVILNVRKDVDAWRRSVMQTLMPLHRSWKFWVRSWFCAELFWVREGFMRGNWDKFYRGDFEKHSRTVLEEHCQAVRSQVAPERLLEWELLLTPYVFITLVQCGESAAGEANLGLYALCAGLGVGIFDLQAISAEGRKQLIDWDTASLRQPRLETVSTAIEKRRRGQPTSIDIESWVMETYKNSLDLQVWPRSHQVAAPRRIAKRPMALAVLTAWSQSRRTL
ncbi:hypothetical protein MY10362_005485 [Beauveria mimosiformis]